MELNISRSAEPGGSGAASSPPASHVRCGHSLAGASTPLPSTVRPQHRPTCPANCLPVSILPYSGLLSAENNFIPTHNVMWSLVSQPDEQCSALLGLERTARHCCCQSPRATQWIVLTSPPFSPHQSCLKLHCWYLCRQADDAMNSWQRATASLYTSSDNIHMLFMPYIVTAAMVNTKSWPLGANCILMQLLQRIFVYRLYRYWVELGDWVAVCCIDEMILTFGGRRSGTSLPRPENSGVQWCGVQQVRHSTPVSRWVRSTTPQHKPPENLHGIPAGWGK